MCQLFSQPESVQEQRDRLQREAEAQLARDRRQELPDRADRRLIGKTGELHQADFLDPQLFNQ